MVLFKWIKKIWFGFAHIMEFITSTIILTFIYFIIIGIYALVSKLLRSSTKLDRGSSWKPYLPSSRELSKFEQEF